MKILKAFERGGDGAHCGLSDWYPEKEAALVQALASGEPFDTGWYASKKEIATARIYSPDGKIVLVEASVSDDFDTPGFGEATAESNSLEAVSEAIYRAWEEAEGDQEDNREYVAYSLIHWSTAIPQWRRNQDEKRKRYGRKRQQVLDYLILPSPGCDRDEPPGDNYSFWGWQNDCEGDDEAAYGQRCVEQGIPARTAKRLEEFARNLQPGSLRIGDWEIKSWDERPQI